MSPAVHHAHRRADRCRRCGSRGSDAGRRHVNAIGPLAQAAGVDYDGEANLFLEPGFVLRYAARRGIPVQDVLGTNIYNVRLRHGHADWNAFATAASKLDPNTQLQSEADGGGSSAQVAATSAQRGVHVEVVALLLFGVFAALVTLVLVGQLMGRQILIERREYALVRTLGASHSTTTQPLRPRHPRSHDWAGV
jgi:hypothetical protein